jgi:hypothetical protein
MGFLFVVCGYWQLDTGCWILVTGCWVLVTGYWLLGIGYWVLGIGYWLCGIASLTLFYKWIEFIHSSIVNRHWFLVIR